MLYLIEPSTDMRWCNLPARMALEAAYEHEVDLSKLDWQPTNQRSDETAVALALRYGVKCPAGIVLDARYIWMQHHPSEIAASHERFMRSHDALAETTAWMERLFPGSAEHRRALDEGVAEESRRAGERAQADLDQALADRDVDPDLLAHWTKLGGSTPSSESFRGPSPP